MAQPPVWLTRLAGVVGPTGPPTPLGSDIWKVSAGNCTLVAKLGANALDEAAGLETLMAVPGAPPVPEVVFAEADLLVTTWVEQVPRSPGHEESFGRALAVLHSAPFPRWGGGSSWIGACRVDPASYPDAAAFYGARLGRLSTRCGLERWVSAVAARLGDLLPPGGPALLHGDLWWGNVLWGADGQTWLIDPSVHGGHPEEDLAMLALFGAVPDRLFRAYAEVYPLSPGWEERVPLFQLYPLLVHAVLFGDGYRAQAEDVAKRFA
jgi:fructosamine-3-kinase